MKELSDSIRRCLADCEKLQQFETGNVIIQLVELVAEMREAFIYHKDVVGILPASSSNALTKADALLEGLKEGV
jgi:hypothetical protein